MSQPPSHVVVYLSIRKIEVDHVIMGNPQAVACARLVNQSVHCKERTKYQHLLKALMLAGAEDMKWSVKNSTALSQRLPEDVHDAWVVREDIPLINLEDNLRCSGGCVEEKTDPCCE